MSDAGPGDPAASNRGEISVQARPRAPLHLVQQQPVKINPPPAQISYNRHELQTILNVYGRKVAEGEWRDYALDFGAQTAVFSIFRRTSEMPLYRIIKDPRLARRQGMYSVVTATGLILKRGAELDRVIAVLDKKLKLVDR